MKEYMKHERLSTHHWISKTGTILSIFYICSLLQLNTLLNLVEKENLNQIKHTQAH